jgi:hypothetical protein
MNNILFYSIFLATKQEWIHQRANGTKSKKNMHVHALVHSSKLKKEVQKSDYSEHHSHFTIQFDNRKNKKPKIASLSSFFPIKNNQGVEKRNRERKSFTFFIVGFASTRTKTKKKKKKRNENFRWQTFSSNHEGACSCI